MLNNFSCSCEDVQKRTALKIAVDPNFILYCAKMVVYVCHKRKLERELTPRLRPSGVGHTLPFIRENYVSKFSEEKQYFSTVYSCKRVMRVYLSLYRQLK